MGAAQQALVGGSYRRTVTVTISTDTPGFVANTAQVPGYLRGQTDVTFIINYAIISAIGTGYYAFTVDTSWAANDTVKVINYGSIVGAGGDGGQGGSYPGSAGLMGSAGGSAMYVTRPITFINYGFVASGGGGGGGGGTGQAIFGITTGGGGGGGGRGQVFGSGALGGLNFNQVNRAGAGSDGTFTAGGGAGGAGAGGTNVAAGNGGSGGSWGTAGANGSSGYYPGGLGGAAGAYALYGKSYVNGGAGLGGTVYGAQG